MHHDLTSIDKRLSNALLQACKTLGPKDKKTLLIKALIYMHDHQIERKKASNNLHLLKMLCKQNTNNSPINLDVDMKYGMNPLMYALYYQYDKSIIQLMIEAGVDCNQKDIEGRTPIMYALGNQFDDSIIKLLIDNHANCGTLDFKTNSVLWYACNAGASTETIKLLFAADSNLDKSNQVRIAACIQTAIKEGHHNIVDVLLGHIQLNKDLVHDFIKHAANSGSPSLVSSLINKAQAKNIPVSLSVMNAFWQLEITAAITLLIVKIKLYMNESPKGSMNEEHRLIITEEHRLIITEDLENNAVPLSSGEILTTGARVVNNMNQNNNVHTDNDATTGNENSLKDTPLLKNEHEIKPSMSG